MKLHSIDIFMYKIGQAEWRINARKLGLGSWSDLYDSKLVFSSRSLNNKN